MIQIDLRNDSSRLLYDQTTKTKIKVQLFKATRDAHIQSHSIQLHGQHKQHNMQH